MKHFAWMHGARIDQLICVQTVKILNGTACGSIIDAMLIIIMMYEEICVLILINFDVHTSQLLLLGSMANNHVAMITDSGIVIHSPSIAITSQNRDLHHRTIIIIIL